MNRTKWSMFDRHHPVCHHRLRYRKSLSTNGLKKRRSVRRHAGGIEWRKRVKKRSNRMVVWGKGLMNEKRKIAAHRQQKHVKRNQGWGSVGKFLTETNEKRILIMGEKLWRKSHAKMRGSSAYLCSRRFFQWVGAESKGTINDEMLEHCVIGRLGTCRAWKKSAVAKKRWRLFGLLLDRPPGPLKVVENFPFPHL